jgi:2,3-diketo-5-methylthio-1-phosphopentane phosphatase
MCFLILADFDGTIFMQDTGHVLFDTYGCGTEKRQALDEQIKTGERSFRDVSEEMWGSLNVPFDDGFVVMKEQLEIDSGFRDFHQFCIKEKIPFNVISAGLKPVLREVLQQFLGEKEVSQFLSFSSNNADAVKAMRIDIIANEADISEDGSEWKPVWLHDTELGHDKAKSVQDCRSAAEAECEEGHVPLIVFIGDGVSDLPAAREADVLFARRGLRLEEYCIEHKIPHIPFDSFTDIKSELTRIMKEDEELTKGHGNPVVFNPRANMWRRVSSSKGKSILVAATPRDERMFIWPEAFTTPSPKLERSLSSLMPTSTHLPTRVA